MRKRRPIELLEDRSMLSGLGKPIPFVFEADLDANVAEETAAGQTPQLKIVGGASANISDWDWIVALTDSFGQFCGGSLIAADVVLTAAHCVDTASPSSVTVVSGRQDLRTNSGQELPVRSIVVHPDYDDFELVNDLALLFLSAPSSHTPIDIVRSDQLHLTEPGTMARTAGWGETDTSFYSDILREVEVPIIANSVANRQDAYAGDVRPSMMAAGSEGKDSCYGDSGGPLVVPNDNGGFSLAGITSWGYGCGAYGLPGVYTRVSSFDSWIIDQALPSSQGNLYIDSRAVITNSTFQISLSDLDLDQTGELIITTTGGDTETIQLAATSTGRFFGGIEVVANSSVATGNGRLEVAAHQRVTVEYLDADDGTGNARTLVVELPVVIDDHPNEPARAVPTEIGRYSDGEIEVAGDVDCFSFDVTEGSIYTIEVRPDTLGDSYLELVDGDGNLLAFNDDAIGFSSIVNYLAAESTTLYAKVSGYGDATGEYRLFVRNARYTDDHSNLASDASEIAIPAELTGEININTDVDWLRFQASSNQPYVIEGTPNDIDGINLELYDANGVPIASSGFDSDRGRILFVAAADQTYTLRIAGQDSASEGSYDLSITPLSSVVVGESVTGRIFTSSEIVFFAFEAVAGENYAASAQAITLTDLRMQLFDSSGNLVSQNDDAGDSVDPTILWQASDDTTYFMGVTEVSGETGKFELTVEPLSFADDHANSAENATRLEINSKTKGVLEVTGELDWFTFSAVAGETYLIQTRLGSLAQSELHLVSPDGTTDIETTDVSEDSGARFVWTPTESGDYFVYVSGEGSGTYDVALASYQDDHANSAENATNLVLGVVASGELLPVGDEDWFQFSVYEGDVYQFRAESLSGTRMDVRLMDQDGSTELLSVSSNADTQYWQAPADAAVYLNVSSASTGHYQLYVSEVKSLQIGNEVKGVIGSAAEVDSFQFSAFAGIEYSIQVVTPFFTSALVTISDLRGNTLTTHDTDYGFESTFQWTPDRNGRFLISVESVTSNPIGNYSLEIQKNFSVYSEIGDSAATSVPLPINHTVDSAIDFSDDVDWFQFEAEAGQRYTFTTELISLFDSALTIYDQDGNELAYNDDANFNTYASNIRWTAPAAGVFFVEVSGVFGDTGTYRLISSGPALTGDFDRNGTVNVNDLDLLCARLSIGSTADRYDVNGDGAVNGSDVTYMLENVLRTVTGDVNLDGRFDSADLVKIFSAGEYEDSRTDNSVWSTGDWNCDGDFDSSDLIVAFSAGSYSNDATRPISSQTSLNDIAVALLYSDPKRPSSSLL